MEVDAVVKPIPYDVAVQLCAEIRQEAELNWHTPAARWCWSCQESIRDNPEERGFMRSPGNRGCILINARFTE